MTEIKIEARLLQNGLYELDCPFCGEKFKRTRKYINKHIQRGGRALTCSLNCNRAFQNINYDKEVAKKIRDPEFRAMVIDMYVNGNKSLLDLEIALGMGKKALRGIVGDVLDNEEVLQRGYTVKNQKIRETQARRREQAPQGCTVCFV